MLIFFCLRLIRGVHYLGQQFLCDPYHWPHTGYRTNTMLNIGSDLYGLGQREELGNKDLTQRGQNEHYTMGPRKPSDFSLSIA